VSEPGSPVDPRDLEVLRANRPPDPSVRARVRARLAAVVPLGSPGGASGPGGHEGGVPEPPPSTTAPVRAMGTTAARAIGAVAFVVGGVTGAMLHAAFVKRPAPQVVYVDRTVDRPAPAVPAAPARPAAPPSSSSPATAAAAPAAVAATPAPPARSAPRPSSSHGRASQLSAERAMLDDARAALVAGDAARALDLVERHRRTFANALLAEERDALEVQSLVKAGRYDEARARADAFRRRAPDSLFLPMVDSAVESIP